jgi:Cft2 family RNA processing exonuclease
MTIDAGAIDAGAGATYLIGMFDVVTRAEQLLVNGPAGLYCPAGDFYIDPMRPVDRAVITHGHADHARPGHAHVLATAETLAIMAARQGGSAGHATQAPHQTSEAGRASRARAPGSAPPRRPPFPHPQRAPGA